MKEKEVYNVVTNAQKVQRYHSGRNEWEYKRELEASAAIKRVTKCGRGNATLQRS